LRSGPFRPFDSRFRQSPADAARDTEDSLNQAGYFEFAMRVGCRSSVEMMCDAIGMPCRCIALGDRSEHFVCFFAHGLRITISFARGIVEAQAMYELAETTTFATSCFRHSR